MGTRRTLLYFAVIALALVGVVVAVLSSGFLITRQAVPANGNLGNNNSNSSNTNSDPGNTNSNSGNVVSGSLGVGVHSDAAATTTCSSISWGNLTAGGSVTKTIYLKNTGDANETLSLTTTGWSPASVSSSLSLTWNLEGAVLAVCQVVPATFTLTAAENAGSQTSFSFNIVISGSG